MKYFTLLTLLVFAFACGSDADSGTTTLNEAIDAADAAVGSNATSCLGEEGRSLCDFLTADVLDKYLPAGYEKQGYRETQRSLSSVCKVSVDDPEKTRAMQVAGMSIDVPVNYSIAISSVITREKDASLEFDRNFKTLTAAEKEELKANAQTELDKKVAAGELSADQSDLADGFLNMAANARYEAVSGVGDKAVSGGVRPKVIPESYEELRVLSGNTYFTLAVDLGQSRAHSLEAAKEIARSILLICE